VVAVGLKGKVSLKLYTFFATNRQWTDADAGLFEYDDASMLQSVLKRCEIRPQKGKLPFRMPLCTPSKKDDRRLAFCS
jgi:hypothetical protein